MGPKAIMGLVGTAVLGLAAVITMFLSAYTVEQGERAVLLRFGKAIDVTTPGFHFKLPWADSVTRISVRTQTVDWTGDPDSRGNLGELEAYSRDQQPADIAARLTYVVNPDRDSILYLFGQYGSLEGYERAVVVPTATEETKNVFGQFNAVTSVQERSRLNNEVESTIAAAIIGPGSIQGFQIQNIDFSKAYEDSIEQRMLAEVEVEKIRQNLERERTNAEIKVVQAGAAAEQVRLAGEAEAAALRATLEAREAEAVALRARGEALRDFPELVALNAVEKWDGVLPTTMPPGSTVPFLNLPGAAQ